MGPLNVLVVEDDDSIREMIQLTLASADHLSVGAANGDEALRLLERLSPDMILLDLRMPVVDGIEFMRGYREMDGRAPVVLLTAGRDMADARELGAAGLIEKPFDVEALIATVEQVARGREPATL